MIAFSHAQVNLRFQVEDSHLHLTELSPTAGPSWLHPDLPSELFACHVAGKRWSAPGFTLVQVQQAQDDGVRQTIFSLEGGGIRVDYTVRQYPEAVLEFWPVIRNGTEQEIVLGRIDSLSLHLPALSAELLSFRGDWGAEFEPHRTALRQEILLESRSGRSSKGDHPWFALARAEGGLLSASVAWSGNWILRLTPLPDGGFCLSGGLNDWEFETSLAPGGSIQGAPVLLTLGKDLDHVSQQMARTGRKYWYPVNDLSSTLPVEWNHWWPYEDVEIDETVFLQNVEKAAAMGVEVCTLDAGWFGPSDPGTFWGEYRGDWHLVNQKRFPGGIRALADFVHGLGMKFGLWCEIEGLGARAALAREHPEFIARRDGEAIGQVCLGNPAAQAWAYQTLRRLITEYACDWIKIDFNLDPGAGCNRTDHGHGSGDGLYAHVQGYYTVMERLRRDFPQVLLESCSSGGLRIAHVTFLSDRDDPEHSLQVFWGASTMLAPDVLLHWTFSHWRSTDPPPYQTFDPHDPALTRGRWDFLARISMLGVFGLSQKLPELPEWLSHRIAENIHVYKTQVRRFVREADLYRLTGQPLRDGRGDRWAAFQYSLPDGSEHLLFTFRLPGGEPERSIRLKALRPERVYRIQGLGGEADFERSGRDLMEPGLLFDQLAEQESSLLRLS